MRSEHDSVLSGQQRSWTDPATCSIQAWYKAVASTIPYQMGLATYIKHQSESRTNVIIGLLRWD